MGRVLARVGVMGTNPPSDGARSVAEAPGMGLPCDGALGSTGAAATGAAATGAAAAGAGGGGAFTMPADTGGGGTPAGSGGSGAGAGGEAAAGGGGAAAGGGPGGVTGAGGRPGGVGADMALKFCLKFRRRWGRENEGSGGREGRGGGALSSAVGLRQRWVCVGDI
jgi:hypothetical protein